MLKIAITGSVALAAYIAAYFWTVYSLALVPIGLVAVTTVLWAGFRHFNPRRSRCVACAHIAFLSYFVSACASLPILVFSHFDRPASYHLLVAIGLAGVVIILSFLQVWSQKKPD